MPSTGGGGGITGPTSTAAAESDWAVPVGGRTGLPISLLGRQWATLRTAVVNRRQKIWKKVWKL